MLQSLTWSLKQISIGFTCTIFNCFLVQSLNFFSLVHIKNLFFFLHEYIWDPCFIQQSGNIVFREQLRPRLWLRTLSLDFCLISSKKADSILKWSKIKDWSSLLNVNLKVSVDPNKRRSWGKEQHSNPWGNSLCQEKGEGRESKVSLMLWKTALLELFCLWSLPEDLNSLNSDISQEDLCFSHFKLYKHLKAIWAIRPKISCSLRNRHSWQNRICSQSFKYTAISFGA